MTPADEEPRPSGTVIDPTASPAPQPAAPNGAGRLPRQHPLAPTGAEDPPAPTGAEDPPAPTGATPPAKPADTARAAAPVDARPPGRWRRLAIDTRPLRHPAYRRLFIGNSVSSFGYQFTAVAVPVQIYAQTRSSAWVGLLGGASLVPLLIFGLYGGAIADAVDRRKLLLASSLLMWASTLGLFAQSLAGLRSPLLLLLLVAVQAMAFGISTPTRAAILPRLVPAEEVAAANTLSFTMFNAATVAGPISAGLLLANYSLFTAYALDAVLFTVALWAALRLPALRPERTGAAARSRTRDVLEGLRFIAGRPVLLLSFAIDIVAMVLALPRALFPQVADERFGGAFAVGWLYAAIALGSVVAGLSSGWIGRVRRQGLALVISVVAWGLAVGAAGLAPWLWACVLLLAVGGAADLVSAVYRQTILQLYAPDEMRGRMQGVFTAVVAGGPRLGDMRAGLVAAAIGPPMGATISWAGGGLVAAVTALVLAVSFPALLRYTAPRVLH